MNKPTALILIFISTLFTSCSGGGVSSSNSIADEQNITNETLHFINTQTNIEVSSYGVIYSGNYMASFRTQHQMIEMYDGRLLISGGRSVSGLFGNHIYSRTEIFDPITGIWNYNSSVKERSYSVKMVALLNNRVLIGSGKNAEVLDVNNQIVSTITDPNCMSTIESGLASVLLPDGRVLLTGSNLQHVGVAEIYHPDQEEFGCFEIIPGLTSTREGNTFTIVDDGRVLLAGGNGYQFANAEWFDPSNNTFQAIENPMMRQRLGHSATLLNNGKILIAGGYDGQHHIASAEIFDPETESFSYTQNDMNIARSNAHLMPIESGVRAGKVLVVGGYMADSLYGSSEIEVFDPEIESFSSIGLEFPNPSSYGAMSTYGKGRYVYTGGYYGLNNMTIIDTNFVWVGTLGVKGGTAPYQFSITTGTGEIDADTGKISLPFLEQNISVRVTDANGNTANHSFTVHFTE